KSNSAGAVSALVAARAVPLCSRARRVKSIIAILPHDCLEFAIFAFSEARRLPVASSNRCTSLGSGLRRTLSPGWKRWRSRNTATDRKSVVEGEVGRGGDGGRRESARGRGARRGQRRY